jgi:hypothetical protein
LNGFCYTHLFRYAAISKALRAQVDSPIHAFKPLSGWKESCGES